MTTIREMFNKKIIEKDLFQVYFDQSSSKNDEKIEYYENLFKDVNFYKKKTFDYGTKYYLQNKQKEELNNIQESLRDKIINLNYTFSENAYFLDISKETLEKTGNKHKYNVFKISLLEYNKINLYEDIILESESFFSDDFFPIQFSNISQNLRIDLYERLIKFIKKNKNLIDRDEKNEIEFHDLLLINLKRELITFFIKLYKNDKHLDFIISEICKNEPSFKSKSVFSVEDFLEKLLKTPSSDNITLINKIMNIYILKKWDISMNILNVDLMEILLTNISKEEIFKI